MARKTIRKTKNKNKNNNIEYKKKSARFRKGKSKKKSKKKSRKQCGGGVCEYNQVSLRNILNDINKPEMAKFINGANQIVLLGEEKNQPLDRESAQYKLNELNDGNDAYLVRFSTNTSGCVLSLRYIKDGTIEHIPIPPPPLHYDDESPLARIGPNGELQPVQSGNVPMGTGMAKMARTQPPKNYGDDKNPFFSHESPPAPTTEFHSSNPFA